VTKRSTAGHRALIVEDDAEAAEDLSEIVGSLGWERVVAASRDEASGILRDQEICIVLLDLQIKDTPRSIKGHVEHGRELLREIRRGHGELVGQKFWLPVLIVSGYAREVPEAVEVMRDGASDLVQKPFNSREVSQKLRSALKESGRSSHDACRAGFCPSGPYSGDDVEIAIPGERVHRRTVVMLGNSRLEVTDGSLRVLLHLLIAHGEGRAAHKTDLGASDDQGFKGISLLRSELKPALGRGVNIIKSEYYGNYRLSSHVRLGDCNLAALHSIGDNRISDLVRRLKPHLPAPKKKV
jgi:DNA-binding response OmpR family regulator